MGDEDRPKSIWNPYKIKTMFLIIFYSLTLSFAVAAVLFFF